MLRLGYSNEVVDVNILKLLICNLTPIDSLLIKHLNNLRFQKIKSKIYADIGHLSPAWACRLGSKPASGLKHCKAGGRHFLLC